MPERPFIIQNTENAQLEVEERGKALMLIVTDRYFTRVEFELNRTHASRLRKRLDAFLDVCKKKKS